MLDPTSVNQVLSTPGGPLYALADRSDKIKQLTDYMREILPPRMRSHLLCAHFDGDCLHLYSDSPVWRSLLQLQAPTLVRAARDHYAWSGLRRSRVRILPPTMGKGHPIPVTRPRLSPAAVASIRGLAETTDDPRLASALQRLACTD